MMKSAYIIILPKIRPDRAPNVAPPPNGASATLIILPVVRIESFGDQNPPPRPRGDAT